jgi:hypothetical protein
VFSSLKAAQKVQDYDFEKFPIDLKAYKPLALSPSSKKLSEDEKKHLVNPGTMHSWSAV